MSLWIMSVETLPGAMTLAVTSEWAISWATDLVSPMTPHLEAQ